MKTFQEWLNERELREEDGGGSGGDAGGDLGGASDGGGTDTADVAQFSRPIGTNCRCDKKKKKKKSV